MPNDDDLGQFPTPSDSMTPSVSLVDPQNIPNLTSDTTPPTFEETPDEIPSSITVPAEPAPTSPPPPAPVAATIPTPKGGSVFGSLIAIVLLLISGVAMAVTVFLFSQSRQLKQQLSEVTKTLEQQRTTITPSPTPTVIEFPTPTQEATESAIIVPTPTATPSAITSVTTPLASASRVLKVAINHLPNAQMIIIKTENATSPTQATTKYFFRQDLTTKKYFYVLVTNNNEPEVIDKAIYVTPDNNIPSLNDSILANTLGIDLDEAIKVASAACISKLCDTAGIKAQYIHSGDTFIWQLTFTPLDPNKSQLIAQINAKTKEILYKSAGF